MEGTFTLNERWRWSQSSVEKMFLPLFHAVLVILQTSRHIVACHGVGAHIQWALCSGRKLSTVDMMINCVAVKIWFIHFGCGRQKVYPTTQVFVKNPQLHKKVHTGCFPGIYWVLDEVILETANYDMNFMIPQVKYYLTKSFHAHSAHKHTHTLEVKSPVFTALAVF